MKKIIFTGLIGLIGIGFPNSTKANVWTWLGNAIKVTIKYERGAKEWNSDHTKAECIGKGMCTFSAGTSIVTFPVTGDYTDAALVNFNGRLGIIFNSTYISNFPEDFANNKYAINTQIKINSKIANELSYSGQLNFEPKIYDVEFNSNHSLAIVYLN
jgi:hypothetical protein